MQGLLVYSEKKYNIFPVNYQGQFLKCNSLF